MASDDLNTEFLETAREAPQIEDQRKCSTLGERRIKTQGSKMGLTEMKMRVIRSVL